MIRRGEYEKPASGCFTDGCGSGGDQWVRKGRGVKKKGEKNRCPKSPATAPGQPSTKKRREEI